jgi:Ig-like domain CHU_C associated/Secretion system C-terminal sorting domain
MKITLFSRKLTGSLLMLLLFCSLIFPSRGYGQKIYANNQTNQVNGLCLLCGVSNPGNAINSNLNDYSNFVISVGLLGVSVEQTLIFPAASSAGCDSLIVGIGSGDPILSANLFGGITIQTYNGSVANNDAQVAAAGVLRLLDSNTRAEVLLKPAAQFDRVKVTLNSSLVGLLTSFRLYYAYHQSTIPPAPVVIPAGATICSGDTVILSATPVSGATVTWYTSNTGGAPFATGNSITADPTSTTTYYATATVAGCSSARTPVTVTVNQPPAQPVVSNSATICTGDTAVLTATGPNIKWYNNASGGTLLFTGNPYRVSPPAFTLYYAQADTLGCISARAAANVNVVAKPAVPTLASDTVTICYGDSALLRAVAPAGVTFRWYYNATGGSPVISGATVILYNQPVTATFYVDAVNSNGCVSVSRKPVTVLVNPVPAIPVYSVPSPANQPLIIPITNHQNGVVYNVRIRYAGGLTAPFDTTFTQTGDTIHAPVYNSTQDSNADIYVQTINAVTGCTSITIHQSFIIKGNLLPLTAATAQAAVVAVSEKQPGEKIEPLAFYPNPSNGVIQIQTKEDLTGSVVIVNNLEGKPVYRSVLGTNNVHLPATLTGGIYVIQVRTKTGRIFTGKVMLKR